MNIKPGDEVIWVNDDTYSLTLVSKEGLFEDKLLDNDKQISYIFKKIGTYNFDIVVLGVKKFSGTVVVEP
jgi:plastocyanin